MTTFKKIFFKIFWKKKILNENLDVFSALRYVKEYLPLLRSAITEGKYIRLVFFKLVKEDHRYLLPSMDTFWWDIYQNTKKIDESKPGKEYDRAKNEALGAIALIKEQMAKNF